MASLRTGFICLSAKGVRFTGGFRENPEPELAALRGYWRYQIRVYTYIARQRWVILPRAGLVNARLVSA
jgi:hypothetical protein